jgi:hypothetical protein
MVRIPSFITKLWNYSTRIIFFSKVHLHVNYIYIFHKSGSKCYFWRMQLELGDGKNVNLSNNSNVNFWTCTLNVGSWFSTIGFGLFI